MTDCTLKLRDSINPFYFKLLLLGISSQQEVKKQSQGHTSCLGSYRSETESLNLITETWNGKQTHLAINNITQNSISHSGNFQNSSLGYHSVLYTHCAHETLPSRLQSSPSNAIIISVVLVRKLRLSLSQSYKKN